MHNLSHNYRILSRTLFELVFIVAAIVFLVAFTLISRASRQTPFRIITKNVSQFTFRRRTVDSAKEKL